MSDDRPGRSMDGRLLWALVAAAALARLAFPGADPKFEYWVGWVTDEGRWVETARNLALFGEPRLYALSKLHLALGPGHQAAAFASFQIFGVGLVPARLWTILCAVALVVAVARAVGRIAPGWPAVLSVVVVGFEPLTVALSRTALPEIPSLLFTLLAFLALLAGRRRVLAAAVAGLLFAVALAMKATTVLVGPALVLAILCAGTRESARERFVRLAAFCAAVGIPALAGLAAAWVTGVMRIDSIAEVKAPLVAAFGFGGPYALLERLAVHRSSYGSVLVLLLLAWQGSWVAPFWREWRGTPLGETFLHSGIWTATWLLGVGMLAYTPSRYSVHCLVPLAIHASAGIALWRQVGAGRVAHAMSGARGMKGALVEAWLWLPLGLSGSTAMMVLAAQSGMAIDRLSLRLAFGLAVVVALAVATHRSGAARFDRRAVVATVTAGTGAFLVDAFWEEFVPGSGAGPALALAKLAIFAAAVVWILAARKGREDGADSIHALGPVVVAVAAAFAVRAVPPLLLPTHSLQEASRTVTERFAGAHLVRSYSAGSLLVGTPFAYRDEDVRGALPDAIVSVSPAFRSPEGFVKIGALYVDTHPRFAVAARMNLEGGRVRADLYRDERHATAPPGPVAPGASRPYR